MKSLKQGVHERDNTLGRLRRVEIVRDPVFCNPTGIKFIWECQKCHDTFETIMPYLEILCLGDKK